MAKNQDAAKDTGDAVSSEEVEQIFAAARAEEEKQAILDAAGEVEKGEKIFVSKRYPSLIVARQDAPNIQFSRGIFKTSDKEIIEILTGDLGAEVTEFKG